MQQTEQVKAPPGSPLFLKKIVEIWSTSWHNFFVWLGVESTLLGSFSYIIFAAIIIASLEYAVEAAMINWGIIPAPALPEIGDTPFKYANAFEFVSMFLWAPLKEEVIFRILPLSIVIAFVSRSPAFVFWALAFFTALFGAIHPYGVTGKTEVAIAGFFFGLVFLKCGGLNKSFVKASLCVIATHGLSNGFIFLDTWWRYFEATGA